jgi:tRNA threonylcarbamoyladenosine biosynthesis protein TsaB
MEERFVHEQCLRLSKTLGGPLLGIDTSTMQASMVAVGWKPGCVHEESIPAQALPSERLAGVLWGWVDAFQCPLKNLKAVVVGLGPGSFTGLRVGLALAKGIVQPHRIPLVGVSSFAAYAMSAGPGDVAVAADARHGEVFGGMYRVASDGTYTNLIADGLYQPEAYASEVHALSSGARWVGECVPATGHVVESVPLRMACIMGSVRAETCVWDADAMVGMLPRYLRVSEPERKKAEQERLLQGTGEPSSSK